MTVVDPKAGFIIGKSYRAKDGSVVEIVDNHYDYGYAYATVKGSDGIWRYNRFRDLGRVTGSDFCMSHPKNLLLPAVEKEEV